jgi:hypothetical protein
MSSSHQIVDWPYGRITLNTENQNVDFKNDKIEKHRRAVDDDATEVENCDGHSQYLIPVKSDAHYRLATRWFFFVKISIINFYMIFSDTSTETKHVGDTWTSIGCR